MKKILLKVLLLSLLPSLTGCFSISARNKMADERLTVYPGVAAYQSYVTRPFEQLNTEDSIFFGILISPHLAVATVDFPFSFIMDSIYLSSDQKKVNERNERPGEFFKDEWLRLMKSIKTTKLEEALKLIDDVSFKGFWELLKDSPEEEKILFALLKTVNEDKKRFSNKYGKKALIKFPSKSILQVMENTWWPYLVVPKNKRGRNTVRAAYLEGNRARFVMSVSNEEYKSIWGLDLWKEVVFIFEYPEDNTKRYIMATYNSYTKGYRVECFNGKPKGLKLPFVRFPKEEKSSWLNNWIISKWTRPLFPDDVAEHFDFGDNKFGIPEIIQEK